MILCARIRSRSRSSAVTGRGGVSRGREGVNMLEDGVNEGGHSECQATNKSYNLFMTSFSMPSMAFSNSASDAFRQASDSLIFVAMN